MKQRRHRVHLASVIAVGITGWFLAGTRPAPQRIEFPPPLPVVDDTVVSGDFAGAEACADCHADEYAAWRGSAHGRAGGDPSSDVLIAPFDDQPIVFSDATVTPSVDENGTYLFTVEQADLEPVVFQVDGVVGGGHMVGGGTQGFVSGFPDGTVRFLPFDFARRENIWFCNTANIAGWWTHAARARPDRGWVPITSDMKLADCGDWPPIRVLGTNSRFANCQQCHGSQISVHFDGNAGTYETVYTGLDINCESCHGPARSHVERARAGRLGDDVDIGVRELATTDEDSSLMVCFDCHALKRSLTPDYLPGEDFERHYSLRAPAISDNPFFPDGRIRSFGYQQNHLASDCYLNGSMTCVDCHDPHAQSYWDVNRTPLEGRFDDGQCLGCHASKAEDPEAHTNHPPGSTGARCVSCHMPYLQHPNIGDQIAFARSDHTIPIPRPTFDDRLGVQNACGQCHTESATEALQAQTEQWYGEIKPLEQIVRALTGTGSGDAGSDARKLLAPGAWNPLIQVSALNEFVARYLAPDMAALDPGILDSLVALTAYRDVDVQALAYAGLHLARGEDEIVRRFLAGALSNLGDRDAAIRSRWVWALRYYGDEALGRGDAPRAEVLYTKALEVLPDHPGTTLDLAITFASAGDHVTALQYFDRSLQLDPNQPAALVNMAVTLENLGRIDDAMTAYRAATQLNPGESLAHFNLANIHFQRAEYPAAIARYRQAVQSTPDLTNANILLAQSYLFLNQLDSAEVAVRNALSFDPENDVARRMLEALGRR